MGALITSNICIMIENVAMIAGIVYSSIHFNRFSLLWFLLLPAVRMKTYSLFAEPDDEEIEDEA